MAETDADYIMDCWQRQVCPNCQEPLPPGSAVGSGNPKDGRFCSLGCYAVYHEAAIKRRAVQASKPADSKDV